jgi:hypothetical protein
VEILSERDFLGRLFEENGSIMGVTPVKKLLEHLWVVAWLAFVCACAAAETNAQPRYVATVTCFNGKVDSGSFCSATPQESKRDGSVKINSGLKCGLPGKVSEIKLEFVGYQGPADVYRVSRRFPADKPGAVTVTNWTVYYGKRVAVFQDQDQVIVVEPPRKKE